jgi:hypothetical protein
MYYVVVNVFPFSVGTEMPVPGIVHRLVIDYTTLRLTAATDVAAIQISHISTFS